MFGIPLNWRVLAAGTASIVAEGAGRAVSAIAHSGIQKAQELQQLITGQADAGQKFPQARLDDRFIENPYAFACELRRQSSDGREVALFLGSPGILQQLEQEAVKEDVVANTLVAGIIPRSEIPDLSRRVPENVYLYRGDWIFALEDLADKNAVHRIVVTMPKADEVQALQRRAEGFYNALAPGGRVIILVQDKSVLSGFREHLMNIFGGANVQMARRLPYDLPGSPASTSFQPRSLYEIRAIKVDETME